MQLLRSIFIITVLLALPPIAEAQAPSASPAARRVTFQKTLPVGAGAKLDVVLSTQAAFTLSGWDRNEVSVQVDMSGPSLEVEARQEAGNVVVLSRYETVTHPMPASGTIQIRVPRSMGVKAQITNGQVSLTGLSGEITVDTQQGNIVGDDLNGKAYLNTNDGFVRLVGGKLESQVTAQGGSVSFEKVRGKLGGAGPAGHFAVDSPNQPVEASITPGLLTLVVAEGDVQASTANARLDVTWKGDKLTRQRNFLLTAHQGQLVLNLPDGLGVDTFVEQVRSEEIGQDGIVDGKTRKKFESEFDLGELPTEREFTHQGKKHKLTRIEKRVNNGGNRLDIRATNAEIAVKKIK